MKYIEIENKKNYQIVTINRPKVNAINQQMVDELRTVFKEAAADDTVRGVILTGRESVFSAGLDLIELYDYDREQMETFFITFSRLHQELVEFPKIFICAINGHCPAGGTVIALGADYRIMADQPKYTIGLNEVAVNVQISEMLIESYNFWLGSGAAYRNILSGKLLNPDEALADGLIDDKCSGEEVMLRAEKKMKAYLQADPDILANTKQKLRKYWLKAIEQCDHDGDLAQANRVWWSEEVRMKMGMFKQMLKMKNS